MSSNTFTSSSSSYSYSSSSANGHTTSSRYAEQTQSDPSGTTIRTASQNNGEPVIQETRQFDSSGRPMVEGNGVGARGIEGSENRVTDVTDETDKDREAARLYEERMEDEYAKREGGA